MEKELRDIVVSNDATLRNLTSSFEHLASTQNETNKRLEDISKYLAKQAVFSSKLEDMHTNIQEFSKRVGERFEKIETTQSSEIGCGSVRLLKKDVYILYKDIKRIKDEKFIKLSPKVFMWISGFFILYSVTFGTYVVGMIYYLDKEIEVHHAKE